MSVRPKTAAVTRSLRLCLPESGAAAPCQSAKFRAGGSPESHAACKEAEIFAFVSQRLHYDARNQPDASGVDALTLKELQEK
jgi:hypothetical protein